MVRVGRAGVRQRRRGPGRARRDAGRRHRGPHRAAARGHPDRGARPRQAAARRASTGDLLTTDAAAVVDDPDVDVVGRAHRRRRTCPRAHPRRPQGRQAGRHRQQGARSPTPAPSCSQAAEAAGVDLLFEAAVAGGIPIIRPLRESLVGERITRGDGHRQRHHELHPHADDRGGRRLRRRPRRGAGARATPRPTPPPTSRATTPGRRRRSSPASPSAPRSSPATCTTRASPASPPTDIEFARSWATSSSCSPSPSRPTTGEHRRAGPPGDGPASTHPLAAVRESFNAVFVEGAAVGDLMFYGRGAGGGPTASAVLGDLIDAAVNRRKGSHAVGRASSARRPSVRSTTSSRRTTSTSRCSTGPACSPQVAGVFGDHGVSIRSMEQEGLGDEARLIFITHRAREADVQATLDDLRRARAVDRIGSVLRVVGDEADDREVRLDARRRAAARLRRRPPRPGSPPTAASTSRSAWPALPEAAGRTLRPYAEVATDVMWPYVDGSIERADFAAHRRARRTPPSTTPTCARVVELDDAPPAGAVLRADARVQGRRAPARRPAVRPRAHRPGRAGHDRRGHVRRHRLGGHRGVRRPRRRSTSSCSTRPAGCSDVQRRQMTTVDAPNVHNVAVEGTFDDCQDLVKAMFADVAFRDEVRLSRHELDQLGPGDGPGRLLRDHRRRGSAAARSPCPPATSATSSPGGSPSGWGSPVGQLVDRLEHATTSSPAGSSRARSIAEAVVPTLSPAMDIQVSSNHERLLFELLGRDGARTAELLGGSAASGSVEAPARPRFDAASLDDARPRRRHPRRPRPHRRARRPPHGGRHRRRPAGLRPRRRRADGVPGHRPPGEVPRRGRAGHGRSGRRCPTRLADLLERTERFDVLPADLAEVQRHVRAASPAEAFAVGSDRLAREGPGRSGVEPWRGRRGAQTWR